MIHMVFKQLILIPFVTATLNPLLEAQVKPPETRTKPPQLKLEVILLKSSYRVGETVFVKYKLTSLVDGTLCFAPPAVDSTGGFGGSLKTDVIPPPQAADWDLFIEHFWPAHPNAEELRRDVANRWIRLGMSEPFTPKAKARIAVLTTAGDWVLKSTYVPPALNGDDRAVVESFGCTPPDVEVYSTPVIVKVTNAPE
jgi:hypothetical protein